MLITNQRPPNVIEHHLPPEIFGRKDWQNEKHLQKYFEAIDTGSLYDNAKIGQILVWNGAELVWEDMPC